MLWRSCSRSPRTVFALITIPNPSGYCGATSSILQSGSASALRTSNDASATINLESFDISALLRLLLAFLLRVLRELRLRLLADVRHQLHVRPRRRDTDVPLHLLVQRRAEVRAVERIDADASRNPRQRPRLTGLQDQLGRVHAEHREAVEDVPVLLDVRDVEDDRVAHLHAFDVVRREVAADRDHLHVDALARPGDATIRLGLRDPRIRVARE